MRNVSILDGNIFACSYNLEGLPQSDPDCYLYSCGSNSFNAIVYIWLSALLFPAFCCVGLMVSIRGSFELPLNWSGLYRYFYEFVICRLQLFSDSALDELSHVGKFFNNVRQYCLAATCVVVCVYLPVYCFLRSGYSTYSYLYAWTVSATFLSGTAATACLFALWFVFLTIAFVSTNYWGSGFHNIASLPSLDGLSYRTRYMKICMCMFLRTSMWHFWFY